MSPTTKTRLVLETGMVIAGTAITIPVKKQPFGGLVASTPKPISDIHTTRGMRGPFASAAIMIGPERSVDRSTALRGNLPEPVTRAERSIALSWIVAGDPEPADLGREDTFLQTVEAEAFRSIGIA